MANYWVSATGSDANPGTLAQPWLTWAYANNHIHPGDTLYIRGGIYYAQHSWGYNNHASQGLPIVVTNYNGETVILEGTPTNPMPDQGAGLMQVYGNWWTVGGMEIRNSGDNGFTVYGDYATVTDVYSHNNWGAGGYLTGNYSVIQDTDAYANSQKNAGWVMPISWAFGLSACRYPTHCTIRRCRAWGNYGEGISTFESHFITIEDCESWDNGCGFYMSETTDSIFQRNLGYCTPGNEHLPYVTQQSLYIGDEGKTVVSQNNKYLNNVMVGGKRVVGIGGRPLQGCVFVGNTLINAFLYPGNCATVWFYGGDASGAVWRDNVVLEENPAIPIVHWESPTGITFGYNNWSKAPVAAVQGTGDVTGDPLITKTGNYLPGQLTAAYAKLQAGSPARVGGLVHADLVEDYYKTNRPAPPDMGAIQYLSDGGAVLVIQNAALTHGSSTLSFVWGAGVLEPQNCAVASASTSPYFVIPGDLLLGPLGFESRLPELNWESGSPPDLPTGKTIYVDKVELRNGSVRFNFRTEAPRKWTFQWTRLSASQVALFQTLAAYNEPLHFQNKWVSTDWHWVIVTALDVVPISTTAIGGSPGFRLSLTLEEIL